jgi:hypothetical protein
MPEYLNDFIADDNAVRVIDAFVSYANKPLKVADARANRGAAGEKCSRVGSKRDKTKKSAEPVLCCKRLR